MADDSTPLVSSVQVREEEEEEEIDWWRTFLRVETATFLVARKFGAHNGDRNVSTCSACWTFFLFVWWTVTLGVAIALVAIGSTRECPGLDDLPSAMIIYGSFLLYGPVAFFSEHLGIFIGRTMNKDKDWTEWKLNSTLFSWFLLKAAIFITMIVWVILDSQRLFDFYEKYTTCVDPIPTPDPFPDPDSCQCDPAVYWLAFSTLITMYPVFLFSFLYFVVVYVLYVYLYFTNH